MPVTQYIGSRYVPIFADPSEWSSSLSYEPLTIVLHEGNSYTSKQAVPIGIDITNETYWVKTGNFNGQVAALDSRLTREIDALNTSFDEYKDEVNHQFTESMQRFTDDFNTLENTTRSEINTLEETLTNTLEIVNAEFVDNFYTKFKRPNGTRIFSIAHRGFRNEFVPENTVEAFEFACMCAPDLAETDVYFTSDNDMVCMHDNNVGNYISQLSGAPAEYTLAQIQEHYINLGSGVSNYPNCKIPTLAEVLTIVSKYGVPLAIELKEPNLTNARINKIMDAVNTANYSNMVVYTGSYANCVLMKTLNPTAICVVTISSVNDNVIANLRKYTFGAQLDINAANEENIAKLFNAGIPFNVWFRGDVTNTNQYINLVTLGCYAFYFDDIRQANATPASSINEYEGNTDLRGGYLLDMQNSKGLLMCSNCYSGNLIPSYDNVCGIPKSIARVDTEYINKFAKLLIFTANVPRNGLTLSEYNAVTDSWNNRNIASKNFISGNMTYVHWHNAIDKIVAFYSESIKGINDYTPYDFNVHAYKSNIFFASTGSVGGSLTVGNNIFTAPELVCPVNNIATFSFDTIAISDTYELVYGVYFYDSNFKRVTGVSLPFTVVNEGINMVGPYPSATDATYYVIGFRIREIGTSNTPNFTTALDDVTYRSLVPVFMGASFANFTEV